MNSKEEVRDLNDEEPTPLDLGRIKLAQEVWKVLEDLWKAHRPTRDHSSEHLQAIAVDVFRTFKSQLEMLFEEVFGVRVVSVADRRVDQLRELHLTSEGAMLLALFLCVHTIVCEAEILFQRRVLTAIEGCNRYRLIPHRRFLAPHEREPSEQIRYRALRLAFSHLGRTANQISLMLIGDLSQIYAVEILTGWGLNHAALQSRPRLLSATGEPDAEVRFIAAFACQLGERAERIQLLGRKSVITRAIADLEREASDRVRGRKVTCLRSNLAIPAESRAAVDAEAREQLRALRTVAGLVDNPILDLLAVGDTCEEISEKLNMTAGAVRVAKHRAIEKLKAAAKKSRESA